MTANNSDGDTVEIGLRDSIGRRVIFNRWKLKDPRGEFSIFDKYTGIIINSYIRGDAVAVDIKLDSEVDGRDTLLGFPLRVFDYMDVN